MSSLDMLSAMLSLQQRLNDETNALKYFEEAKMLLNVNEDASHGYDNNELREVLENNIGVLDEALKSSEQ